MPPMIEDLMNNDVTSHPPNTWHAGRDLAWTAVPRGLILGIIALVILVSFYICCCTLRRRQSAEKGGNKGEKLTFIQVTLTHSLKSGLHSLRMAHTTLTGDIGHKQPALRPTHIFTGQQSHQQSLLSHAADTQEQQESFPVARV